MMNKHEVKTLCSMCLLQVNETMACAWSFSAGCLIKRLKEIAEEKNKKA